MLTLILLVLALVCFIAAAAGARTGRVNLVGLGLALVTVVWIMPLV